MKIRSHLRLMIGAVLLPVLLFATVLTALFWMQQRTLYDQRFLEGVRAMTIALDTEIDSSVRLLQNFSLEVGSNQRNDFVEPAQRMLATQPLWSMIGVTDLSRAHVMTLDRHQQQVADLLDADTFERVLATKRPALSGLLPTAGSARFVTIIAVPVLTGDEVTQVLYAGIEQPVWQRFIAQYPVPADATVTLLDQNRIIVARTLNSSRWIGMAPKPEFGRAVASQVEGAYRTIGLEGQEFYTAHRRSLTWDWSMATGVPVHGLEAGLRGSAIAMAAGAALTLALAAVLTAVFGRRIAKPIALLAHSAPSLVGDAHPDMRPLQRIAEVADVARAFASAGTLLREREQALSTALDREQQARSEAEAANRAKDEFLAMLSHELRNPLNAIASALVVLENAAINPQTSVRARQVIDRQTRHLRDLVDDLLDVARVTSGKIVLHLQALNLREAVDRALSLQQDSRPDPSAPLEHHLHLNCVDVWVSADETRLQQIIGNLLDNAMKYTPRGGAIDVSVHIDAQDAVLTIRDDGAGIAAEFLPRVFDLFIQGERTLARSEGGLGLGLTLVRRLVELHRGRVAASSPGVGQGSTFSVRLPRIAAPTQTALPPTPLVSQKPGLNIVIVEDNDDSRESLQILLQLQGHRVSAASDGPSGAQKIIESRPTVAVIDIGLPGCDGFEVARRVRAALPSIAVTLIALTGYGQDENREEAHSAGFDAYLVKPLDIVALRALLEPLTAAS